ncbi:hypothetical protein Hydth_0551 [Hydrogenobacter thermophilus TK-6]|uniref:Uncharacterized protein n=1 Tax=Hydrogenobacter thermophilus (strain DSM 6534 / IAM 12695 / TK-6) TaxID=608538 RepID=D3DGR3_HYDTT|nr:hypothetical protein [Hydrogenobacter thermophilus]ADO44951.1 hypothetical protein Hydth_0551 [Hydrogenobacter thermophilus TK-6]BAI69015.1 hypothetical protein HTH_0553 [Hydrogenobacter thermophilus TK-6]
MADPIVRLYDFQPGTIIKSSEVDNELNQLISFLNRIWTNGSWDGVVWKLLAQYVSSDNWTVSDLRTFLAAAHNPDGTIKSDGISDALIYAHNHDSTAHPEVQSALSLLSAGVAFFMS